MSEVADTAAPAPAAPPTDVAAPTSAPEVTTTEAKAAETPAAPTIDQELSAIYRKANPHRENGKFAADPAKPTEPEAPKVEIPTMPASWAKANEEVWKGLTPAARDLVLKREADGEKGVAALKATYEPYKALEAAIKPHEALLASMGKTPVQGVLSLIEAHQKLAGPNKYQHLLEIAQNYGIDVARMFAPQGQRPGQVPWIDNLVNEVRSLRAEREADKRAKVQATEKELTSQIEKFSKAEGREDFETLKPVMAQLLTSGVAEGLDDAYDKAARLNPDIFTKMEAKAKASAEEKVRAETAKKAAAVNVKSSVANTTSPKPLDDELRAIYRKNRAS